MAFSPNLGLTEPTPHDPAQANVWATTVNTNMTLLDSGVAGLLSKSVGGNTNIVLTSTQGAANEARNASFVFSGTLTGNVAVLWPATATSVFSVLNSTSGAFTLSLGVNNGSSSAAGVTQSIARGSVGLFKSNGTDVLTAAAQNPVPLAQLPTGASGANLPVLNSVFDTLWSGPNIFLGEQNLRMDANDGLPNSHPIAFINIAPGSTTQYSGRISWGSASPGALQVGEIYLQI